MYLNKEGNRELALFYKDTLITVYIKQLKHTKVTVYINKLYNEQIKDINIRDNINKKKKCIYSDCSMSIKRDLN